jgi:hypothetical protein
MLRAVQESPTLTERYFAALAGLIEPEDLYTSALLSHAAAS